MNDKASALQKRLFDGECLIESNINQLELLFKILLECGIHIPSWSLAAHLQLSDALWAKLMKHSVTIFLEENLFFI
jgi:hypothetical protein